MLPIVLVRPAVSPQIPAQYPPFLHPLLQEANMKTRTALALIVGVLFTLGTPLTAQEFRGRINGVVTDNTGACCRA